MTPNDQAATLRRLFAQRRVRVFPVLISGARGSAMAAWLAKLATGFARNGERTLVIDAARVHVAAALGLRARFDLAHWFAGECDARNVLLDAAPGLSVVSASRAFDTAARAGGAGLAAALPRLAAVAESDVVLVLVSVAHARLLPTACDCLVPVVATEALMALQRDLIETASRVDIAGFRLLFLGMDRATAATLASRLRETVPASTVHMHAGEPAPLARDLVHIVRAASGWTSAPLTAVAPEPIT